jgi:putative ABC transport system permease protein
MIGIIISVATIFVLVSVSIGLENSIEEQFRSFGTDKFYIQPRGQLGPPGTGFGGQLTIDDVDVIDKISGVKDLTYFVIGNTKVEFKDQTRYLLSIGFPTERGEVFVENGFYKIDEGKFLSSGDKNLIALGSQFKYNAVFSEPLETGDKILINDREFKTRTILQTVGNPQDDKLILMPIDDLREITNVTERIDQIIIQVEEGEDLAEVAKKVRKKLMSSRDVDEETVDFSILTPEELLATVGSVLNILTGFLLGIAAISLLVGGIGIATTMFTSVIERTQEIGVMKAVGAQNKDILSIFTIESGLLGLLGGSIGVLFGYSFATFIEYIAANQLGASILQTATPAWLIFGCLAFSLVIGALSGIIPSYQATKISAVEALRYE